MSKTFCILPWIHLATHPSGNVSTCCISDHKDYVSMARNFTSESNNDVESSDGDQVLNLGSSSLDDIMNSDYFRQVRLEMLNGKIPHGCRRCFFKEAEGVVSKRQIENQEYEHLIDVSKNNTNDDGSLRNVDFGFVELRLGNTCNLKCRTCNPWSSSKWISDHNKLQKKYPEMIEYNTALEKTDWYNTEAFWNDLYEKTSNVEAFYINGGEPTLIKEHFNFLDRLIRDGKTNITLWYNINMTQLSDQIINIWKQFKKVRIGCSIDDVGKRNDYIRSPSKWDQIETNLLKLLQHRDQIEIDITQTVSWMNYYYLEDLFSLGRLHGLDVYHNVVIQPDYYSPCVLPKSIRQNVYDRMKKAMPEDKLKALKYINDADDTPLLFQKAWNINQSLDQIRDEKFVDVFPELYEDLKEFL
jgi:MoaA/NifB/PqqE/SkfB family radical SAM enzyme